MKWNDFNLLEKNVSLYNIFIAIVWLENKWENIKSLRKKEQKTLIHYHEFQLDYCQFKITSFQIICQRNIYKLLSKIITFHISFPPVLLLNLPECQKILYE